jgi:predicted RNase H-like nuclease (RuvC/YqgF family)
MSEQVEQKDEKSKELLSKILEELEDLYKDLSYKMDDIRRVIDRLQRVVDAIDTYGEDDEADNRRETPWYLEQEHDDLLKMIEKLEQRTKEIEQYRETVEQITRYTELVKDKLNGELDIRDLQYVAKASIDYGYITIKFNNNVHLASKPVSSETSINDLLESAVDIANIKGIIWGTLFILGIAEGQDMYEGRVNDVRDYIVDRLKDILDLLKNQ